MRDDAILDPRSSILDPHGGLQIEMDETKLYSWFLGPKAENADMLERLILEALRDCVFWRRNFHPEDDITITEKVKSEDVFQDSPALVRQEFLALLAARLFELLDEHQLRFADG